VYDRRRNGGELFVAGYSSDSVTGLSLSPDGTLILSTSMDATLRVLDVRSFCSGDRELVCLTGHTTGPERSLLRCAWDSEARYVTSGSDNGVVNVWDRMSAKLVYSLPGHKGPVSAVAFHPSEPVLASGGNDSKLFVGELN
jgi:Prp8 binding protein